MSNFVIVSFVEEKIPELFHKSEWPLHVTIIRPFSTERESEDIWSIVEESCQTRTDIKTVGKSRELFGKEQDIPVTELEHTEELIGLHRKLLEKLRPVIKFHPPQYNYRPHITDQSSGSITIGERVQINSVSLVKIDEEKRRVLYSAVLGGN